MTTCKTCNNLSCTCGTPIRMLYCPACGKCGHFWANHSGPFTCMYCGMAFSVLGTSKKYTVVLLEGHSLTWVGVAHTTGLSPDEAFLNAKKFLRPTNPTSLTVATYFDGWVDEVK